MKQKARLKAADLESVYLKLLRYKVKKKIVEKN